MKLVTMLVLHLHHGEQSRRDVRGTLTVTSVRAMRSGMSLVLSLCTTRAMVFQSTLSLNGSHSVCERTKTSCHQ